MAKDKPFEWLDRQEARFCDIRDALCSPSVLGYPDRNKPLRVILGAASTGLGYILTNVNEDGSETQYYTCRPTTGAKHNASRAEHSATHLELAALLAA